MKSVTDWIEDFFYQYMYGEWETLRFSLWLYYYVCILSITTGVGYTMAQEQYLITLILLPFPILFVVGRAYRERYYQTEIEGLGVDNS